MFAAVLWLHLVLLQETFEQRGFWPGLTQMFYSHPSLAIWGLLPLEWMNVPTF